MKTTGSELNDLAAIVYGEASVNNNSDEMYALASVLVRQRDCRGYPDIQTFVTKDKNFSYVVSDGNQRYLKARQELTTAVIDAGLRLSISAAQNALAHGPDLSNGAYFWDGEDIKSNYNHHAKVRVGIKFLDPRHNIYNIKESKFVEVHKFGIKRVAANGQVTETKKEIARRDHRYESTAAFGGTIFWKINPVYIKATNSKEFK